MKKVRADTPAWSRVPTSVDYVVVVEVVDCLENLSNGLGGIFLGELAILADSIEQFAAGG